MTEEELKQLQYRINRWNVESIAKPGARVRIYSVNSDGSVSVEDKAREEVEGHV